MSAIDTISTPSRARAVFRTPRDASTPISAHATSAIGSHPADGEMPVSRRNACPNVATPIIETGGKTMYVPSSAQPVKNPARGPTARPTKAYTEPAWLTKPLNRTNP